MEKGLSNIYELLLLKVGCGVDEIHCVQTVIPRLISKSYLRRTQKDKTLGHCLEAAAITHRNNIPPQ